MPNPSPASLSSSTTRNRRSFQIFGIRRFRFTMDNALDVLINCCAKFAETFILLLGPVLICFASAIISGLSWVFFAIYLPMMQFDMDQKDASPLRRFVEIGFNVAFVVFILAEIIFNYFMCVTTRNAGPKSSYDTVVRELAESTHLEYPQTPQEVARFRRDFNDKITIRIRRRRAREIEERERQHAHSSCCDANGECSSKPSSANNTGIASGATGIASTLSTTAHDVEMVPAISSGGNTPTGENITLRKNTRQQKSTTSNIRKGSGGHVPSPPIRNWMLMAPDEWGYCTKTNQPKPPRSHYDHVSKSLVLCLDHYCPWMFNAIGYFNYRYFVNFLVFVFTGMMYGVFITYRPFSNSTGHLYREQLVQYRKTGVWTRIHPYTPISSERMPLSLAFMLCLAVGIAVACLGGFHIYLVLTGQTTIECHGNYMKRSKAKRSGQKYQNPYDMGSKRNWQQIYGEYNDRWSMFMAIIIPSRREPEFLPLPIGGEEGKRKYLRQLLREENNEMTKPFIASQLSAPATIV